MPRSWFTAGLGWLLLAGAAPALEPAAVTGVWVSASQTCRRVEFAAAGRCFVADCGVTECAYRWEGSTCHCLYPPETAAQLGVEEMLQLTIEGEHLVDGNGDLWDRREHVLKSPWPDVSPVTIRVVDEDSAEPFREFTCDYRLAAADAEFDPLLVRPLAVTSANGTFTITAPPACQLSLTITGPDIVRGFSSFQRLELKTDNRERTLTVKLERGVVVTGVVLDAATGKAVAGATIMPLSRGQATVPDKDKAAVSDAQGRFICRGVYSGLGIEISHPAYFRARVADLEQRAKRQADGSFSLSVPMERGITVTGTVRDPAGQPVAQALISGGDKSCLSAADGAFTIQSPRPREHDKDTYGFEIERVGFTRQRLQVPGPKPAPLTVVLAPLPVLEGQVFDPEGKPVPRFVIAAGPGHEPEGFACRSLKVNDPTGRFRLTAGREWNRPDAEANQLWIGVKAPGAALWETRVPAWVGTKTMEVRLAVGASLVGQVQPPAGHTGLIFAKLLPAGRLTGKNSSSSWIQRQKMAVTEGAVRDGVQLRIDHLTPGRYTLCLYGKGISPSRQGVEVTAAGTDIGTVALVGTGAVFGRIWRPGCPGYDGRRRPRDRAEPWAFARGIVPRGGDGVAGYEHEGSLDFTADQDGRFRVEDVPVGQTAVAIPYFSGCVGNYYTRAANVLEGQATEVRFFDPGDEWAHRLEVRIGDASKEQLAAAVGPELDERDPDDKAPPAPPVLPLGVDLTALGHGPWACFSPADGWVTPPGQSAVALETEGSPILLLDTAPGRYRLRVQVRAPWVVTDGTLLLETELDLPPRGDAAVLRLPAGGSIAGRLLLPGDPDAAATEILAVNPQLQRGVRATTAEAKRQGRFCLQALPTGKYWVVAHNSTAGWCQFGEVSVDRAVADVGEGRFKPGGTIKGVLAHPPDQPAPGRLVAADARGVPVEVWVHQDAPGRAVYEIPGLWPGRWTLRLRRDDVVLATGEATLAGTETVTCDLTVKPQ